MGDRMMDTTQLVNGLAVLFSFFVGYKYAVTRANAETEKKETDTATMRSDDTGALMYSSNGNYKMVLVVRNDLKMGKGKIASQCAHAAVGAFQKAIQRIPKMVRTWENTGSAKIALRVESEMEMMAIKRAAEKELLNTCLIRDAGRTQIEPNSKTVLAIGPAPEEIIDKITGHLKLL